MLSSQAAGGQPRGQRRPRVDVRGPFQAGPAPRAGTILALGPGRRQLLDPQRSRTQLWLCVRWTFRLVFPPRRGLYFFPLTAPVPAAASLPEGSGARAS